MPWWHSGRIPNYKFNDRGFESRQERDNGKKEWIVAFAKDRHLKTRN